VLLAPGEYHCTALMTIKASGVVLRGSGSGEKAGTILALTGAAHAGVVATGVKGGKEIGAPAPITDAYVPSGTSSFHVGSVAGLAKGDTVRVRRPVTAEWVAFMGMDKLVRSGKDEHWISGETVMDRMIREISGTRVTLDIPLSDSLDAKFLQSTGATLVKYEPVGGISQVGIESLRIVSPPQAVEITAAHYSGIHLNELSDAWVRDVALENMVGSIQVGGGAKRVTLEQISMKHETPTKGAAKPADLAVDGTQTLIHRCTGNGADIFYFVTGARVTGPNVLLNCKFEGGGHIQPHQRWATGLLVDRCEVPKSGIDFMNRGEMGSGHGWTIGWSVVWNCTAKTFVIQQPPGSMNWAIGCVGKREKAAMPFGKAPLLPEGIYDSPDEQVTPESLYLAQLRERLGPQALKNVGY
jgi:hypothetical protein